MSRLFLLFSVAILIISGLNAQNAQSLFVETSYSIKAKQHEDILINKAKRAIAYQNDDETISKYTEQLKVDSTSFVANYGIGVFFYSNFQQSKSTFFIERALRHSKDTVIEAHFLLANLYHLSSKYEKAEQYYKQYLSLIENRPSFLSKEDFVFAKMDVLHRIKMCDNGKRVSATKSPLLNSKNDQRISVSYIGDKINSQYDDFGAFFSSNDSLLYYTSKRSAQGDIYVSRIENGKLCPGYNIGSPINTNSYDAVINVSPDGSRIYIYRSGINDGTVYFSDYLGDHWSIPSPLLNIEELSTTFKNTRIYSFVINQSKSELFIVSDRNGGLGGKDIYVSKKTIDSTWGRLENIGAHINSLYDEVSLSLSEDGNTMYFSSNGEKSIGGFDVFVTYKNNGKWSEPISLGSPINTPGDDLFFSFLSKSNRASYSSTVFSGRQTHDLNMLMVDFCDDIKENSIKGFVRGFSSGEINVVNSFTKKAVTSAKISEGKYTLNLPVGMSYIYEIITKGIAPVYTEVLVPFADECKRYDIYQEMTLPKLGDTLKIRSTFLNVAFESSNPYISTYATLLDKEDKSKLKFYKEVALPTYAASKITTSVYDSASGKLISTVQIDGGLLNTDNAGFKDAYTKQLPESSQSAATKTVTTFSFSNTLFDFNQSTVKSEYKVELDKAVKFLLEVKPEATIEINGYSDSKGDANYNMALSEKRAKAVARYLVSKKISKSRIKTIGKGTAQPIAPNTNADGTDNKEGRAQNRRTEIVIK
ncbi:MAG: OmpA family protein [Bacteroidia bacterium]